MFKFRKAVFEDFPALSRIRWMMCQEDGPTKQISESEFVAHCIKFLERTHQTGCWHHWVAELENDIIANITVQQVAMVPRPEDMEGFWCCVTNNFVLPEYRGRGIGTHLLSFALAWSKGVNAELAIVWPSDAARAYYAKAGFTNSNDIHELKFR